jgi:hypothetical protein
MIEFLNRNLRRSEPDYFYRVFELVTTFEADPGNNKLYDDTKNFKGRDLLKCKSDAEVYYKERLNGFKDTSFFLPFATAKEFELGKNAAYSIFLRFVEHYSDDEEIEYTILGDDESEMSESRAVESAVLRGKGYIP